jgi:hypothetical protein
MELDTKLIYSDGPNGDYRDRGDHSEDLQIRGSKSQNPRDKFRKCDNFYLLKFKTWHYLLENDLFPDATTQRMSGSLTVKKLPLPLTDVTSMSPPSRSIYFLEIDRPSPVPS